MKFDNECYFIKNFTQFRVFCKNQELTLSEFFEIVNFEFFVSFKSNSANHLLLFHDSCRENFLWKAFNDFATVWENWGLGGDFIKQNFCQQIQLGLDVCLQKRYIVLFKSSRVVRRFSKASAQLALRSKTVDCYWEARSSRYRQFLIDLQSRTDDQLPYCPKGSYADFLSVNGWKMFWKINTKTLSKLKVLQSFSDKCKSQSLQACSKKFIHFPYRT